VLPNLSKEFKVGLLTIVCGSILYAGFNFLKGIELFSNSHEYYVLYDNIDGLQESNPVVLSGMPVGRVRRIDILQGEKIQMLVTLDIDAQIKITDSCVAVLKDAGLLGGKSVELQISSKGKLLNHQDTIRSNSEMSLMAQAGQRAEPLLNQVDTLLFRTNRVLEKFNDMSDTIGLLLRNTAILSGNAAAMVAENRTNLQKIMGNLQVLSGSLVETEKELKPLLGKMNNIADSVKAMQLATASEKMQKTIQEINTSLVSINSAQGTMGKLLKDSALYVNSNKAIVSLDSLLVDFRKHPKRYVHFSMFGRKDDKKKENK